jgi:hypothetical protein
MRGKTSPFNTPERVAENFQITSFTMMKVDEVLGIRRLTRFSKNISRILFHIEPKLDGLASYIDDRSIGAEITKHLISCTTELETAWNNLRLANIPAAQRQGRVASEFVSNVILLCIPKSVLISLPRKIPISKALTDHPELEVKDLFVPRPFDPTDLRKVKPILKATQLFSSFLHVGESVVKIPEETIEGIKNYRTYVQHPASHGSSEVIQFHFDAFNTRTKRAGAFVTPKRHASFRFEGDQLVALSALIADILDWTVENYLSCGNGDA